MRVLEAAEGHYIVRRDDDPATAHYAPRVYLGSGDSPDQLPRSLGRRIPPRHGRPRSRPSPGRGRPVRGGDTRGGTNAIDSPPQSYLAVP